MGCRDPLLDLAEPIAVGNVSSSVQSKSVEESMAPCVGPPEDESVELCNDEDPVVTFVESIKKDLEQPVLSSPPLLRVTQARRPPPSDDVVPKRSARLAAKSRFRAA